MIVDDNSNVLRFDRPRKAPSPPDN